MMRLHVRPKNNDAHPAASISLRRLSYGNGSDCTPSAVIERFALQGSHRTFEKKCFIKLLNDTKLTIEESKEAPSCWTIAEHPPINLLQDVIPFDEEHFLTKSAHLFALRESFNLMERIINLIQRHQLSEMLKWVVWRIIFKEQNKQDLSGQARERLQQSYIKVFSALDCHRHVIMAPLTNIVVYAAIQVITMLCPHDPFIDLARKAPYQGFLVYVYQQITYDLTGIVIHQSTVKCILENASYVWKEVGDDWPSPFKRSPLYTTTTFSPMVSKLQGVSRLKTKMDCGWKVKSLLLSLPEK